MQQTLNILQQKARLYTKIRAFFDRCDTLEVDTPLLSSTTNTDVHIQSIQARVCGSNQYLQTSPEFAMKRLLAQGSGSIYQICHAFRDEEQGRRHRAEFSMLEWYCVGFDYVELMGQVELLISELIGKQTVFHRVRYFDVFLNSFGLDLNGASTNDLRKVVKQHIKGVNVDQWSLNDCQDLLISQVIAKQFKGFTFVYDYPATQASLARIKPDNSSVAERFELFYGEMELANGFTELTNAQEQRVRFLQDNQRREERGIGTYPVDETFLQALEQGMPECAGVALGLDRLLMVMLGVDDISQVISIAD